MPSDLEEIRQIFPDYPSEFDVAIRPEHWASLAQDFYHAALVIHQENQKVDNWMHNNSGVQITDAIAIRMHGQRAAVFCIAFSIELIIKALYIQEVAAEDMKPNQPLKFATHKSNEWITQIPQVTLTEQELSSISIAEQIIINGKYPASKKPSDSTETINLPNLLYAIEEFSPLYLKLSNLIKQG